MLLRARNRPQKVIAAPGRLVSGFTLIELLMVVLVVLILTGIIFAASRSVYNNQAKTRAQADLAVLSQALEQFKAQNGDYPWTSSSSKAVNGEELFKALLGWKKFERSENGMNFVDKADGDVPAHGPESFIDPESLSYSGVLPQGGIIPRNARFIDPWGNPYVYKYRQTSARGNWQHFGFHLYSLGPDGSEAAGKIDSSSGIKSASYRDSDRNVDNIFEGE